MQPKRVEVVFNLFRDEGSNPSASNFDDLPRLPKARCGG